MRYPASEKLEIIRLVEQSHLPVRREWRPCLIRENANELKFLSLLSN